MEKLKYTQREDIPQHIWWVQLMNLYKREESSRQVFLTSPEKKLYHCLLCLSCYCLIYLPSRFVWLSTAGEGPLPPGKETVGGGQNTDLLIRDKEEEQQMDLLRDPAASRVWTPSHREGDKSVLIRLENGADCPRRVASAPPADLQLENRPRQGVWSCVQGSIKASWDWALQQHLDPFIKFNLN